MTFEYDEESKRALRLMLDAELLGRESVQSQSEPESIAKRLQEIKNEVIASAMLFKGHMFCDGKYIKDTGIVHSLSLATYYRKTLGASGIDVVYNELDAAKKAQEVQRGYDRMRSVFLSHNIHRAELSPFVETLSIITATVDVTRPVRDFADHFIAAYANDSTDCPYEDAKDTMRGLGYPYLAFRVEGITERTNVVYRDAARTRDELVAQVKARFKPYEEERIEAGLHRKY